MKRIVIIQPLAMADIQDHFVYLFEKSPQAASRWVSGIHQAITTLADHADWHPLITEADAFRTPLRQFLYGPGKTRHRVIFEIDGSEVHVLHVRHGMRKPLKAEELDELWPRQ